MTPFTSATRRVRAGILARNLAQLLEFVVGSTGAQYGVGMLRKFALLRRIRANSRRKGAASTFMEQVQLAEAVLNVPKEIAGVVAEFGSFKGMTTATLSQACAMTGRRLVVFDSFEGLPEPEAAVTNIIDGSELDYAKGHYAGSLDEVKGHVKAYGRIDVCEFVKGFFSDTLPRRGGDERYAIIFEDADLPSSVRDVLKHAWPRLQPGCPFFCHEARDREVVEIFFDNAWWRDNLSTTAPGFVGSGLGLELSAVGSHLGYVMKRADT